MPARGTASNRQDATNRGSASGRLAASGRFNVDGGGGPVVDDMTFLDSVTVGGGGAASITFSAISQAYRHLLVLFSCRQDQSAAQLLNCRINADSGANYDFTGQAISTGAANTANVAQTALRVGRVVGTGGPTLAFSTGTIWFPYYSSATRDKSAIGNTASQEGATTATTFNETEAGTWRTSDAITSITLLPGTGSFIATSEFSLYGIT